MKRLILLLLLVIVQGVAAHGLYLDIEHRPPVHSVTAHYEGDIPLPFAQVTLYSPDGEEFQNGRTDRRGRFAFFPDQSGRWKIVVDDEIGHQESLELAIDLDRTQTIEGGPSHSSSPWLKWLLGVTLILLLTALTYIWKGRA